METIIPRHIRLTSHPGNAGGAGLPIDWGASSAALRGPVPATALQSIAQFHLNGSAQEVAKIQSGLAALYQGDDFVDAQGTITLQAMDMLSKITTAKYEPANGAKYPDTSYGRSLMAVAQLIKAELGVEIACVDIGGWDTHAGEGGADGGELPKLLAEFDQSVTQPGRGPFRPFEPGLELIANDAALVPDFEGCHEHLRHRFVREALDAADSTSSSAIITCPVGTCRTRTRSS